MQLSKALYFSSLASVLKVVAQFGLMIVVARLLTPIEYGGFGVALAAAAFVRAFESAGISNFVASFDKLNQTILHTVFTVNLFLNLLIGGLLWAISGPVGTFYSSTAVTDLLELIAVASALNIHQPILNGSLRRALRFKTLLWIDLVMVAVTTITTLVGIYYGYGAQSLAAALVAEKIVAGLLSMFLFPHLVPMKLRFRDYQVVLKYGAPLSLATVIGTLGAHANSIILGRSLGLGPAAQFDRAYSLPRLIWQIALPSFHSVMVPEVARSHRQSEDHRALMMASIRVYIMLLWPIGLVMTIVSPELVILLVGEQWPTAAEIAPYLLLYSLIASPVTLACAPLIALGHGGTLVKLQLVENVCKVLVLLLAVQIGLNLLAISMVIPTGAYIIAALLALSRHKLLKVRTLLSMLLGPLRVCAVCICPALIARIVAMETGSISFAALLAVAAASAVLYVLCLQYWERDLLVRFLQLLGLGNGLAKSGKSEQ